MDTPDVVRTPTPAEERLITGEELARISGVESAELVEGRLVKKMPTGDEHGAVEIAIAAALHNHVRIAKTGKVRSGEVGIYTRRNPDTTRAADVLYISNERYSQRSSSAFLDVSPEIIVEILSPGDSMPEVLQKLREYFAIGVVLVWLIDPTSKTVLVYRSLTNVRELTVNDELTGEDVLPGFVVKVAELFE
ncbi:MAG: Uma2 family endonuclease [Anaerolineae bacterium]|nr:Uma2 family endonuclease [Anaerolineae bacterium]